MAIDNWLVVDCPKGNKQSNSNMDAIMELRGLGRDIHTS